ncbi:AraC family transcriptional regulator [Paenibacillus sp. JNUCC32]|uniref:AraC family transcriptional regulator n=1 Tax=Paenibacillus sp. JNUCC32 TaxID=2777984 RepID=UPI001787BC4D|nr:AraC family transcriptional regulator [Paenibacillus sp. JNUCC-32]QOT12842.1 AraC family transcriptional regulator [Paenibacillus sp. JNUCC-32]
MKRPMETYYGDYFFRDDTLMYVNRNAENFSGSYHNHDFLEIAYIAEGEGFHHMENSVQRVRKGHMFYIPLGMPHVFRPTSSNGKPLIVNNCIFSVNLLPKLIAFASDSRTASLLKQMEDGSLGYRAITDRHDRFEKLFVSLYEQYAMQISGSAVYLHTLLLQLIIEFSRAIEHSQPMTSEPSHPSFHDVLQYVEGQYMHELTLTRLAQISGFSERHLQRLFRRYTGQSWHHYLQTVRIRMSRELLRTTTDKVSMIAEKVGYKDMHSFNSVFKRSTGLTPGQYRSETQHHG